MAAIIPVSSKFTMQSSLSMSTPMRNGSSVSTVHTHDVRGILFASPVTSREGFGPFHGATMERTALRSDMVSVPHRRRFIVVHTRTVVSLYRRGRGQGGKDGRQGHHHKVGSFIKHGLFVRIVALPK